MLEFRNFSKTYKGGKRAVDNLCLNVEAGDIYGFIGHNGAGKTTSLKAACGILDFSEGEILIDGISVRENPVAAKQITAYIPDNPDLYEFMTGIKYLNFIGDIFGVPANERNSRIEKYAAMFELSGDLGSPISSYSHGMKQKLAIISALLHDPRLLVLDEPFVGLDPKASHLLKQIFAEKCEAGAAIFFSTHVLEVAQKLCNKIAIIKNGRLVISGRTEDIVGDSSLEDVFLELAAGDLLDRALDALQGVQLGHDKAVADRRGTHGVFIECCGCNKRRIRFVCNNIAVADHFCRIVDICPRRNRDFAQMRNFLDDIDLFVERLAASVIHKTKRLHNLFHIIDVKFLVHIFRHRTKNLRHTSSPDLTAFDDAAVIFAGQITRERRRTVNFKRLDLKQAKLLHLCGFALFKFGKL